MSKQPVLRQSRKRTEYTAERNVPARFKPRRRAVQHAESGQDTFGRPCAGRPHLGRGIRDTPLGSVGRRRIADHVVGRTRLLNASLVDRLAKRFVLDPELLGRFLPGTATAEQLLRPRGHLLVHHRRPPSSTRTIEGFDALFSIRLHTAFDAALGDAEGAHDLGLSADSLRDQLSGEHAKGPSIFLGMREDRRDAMEIGPLAVAANHAHTVIDLCGPIGDKWE